MLIRPDTVHVRFESAAPGRAQAPATQPVDTFAGSVPPGEPEGRPLPAPSARTEGPPATLVQVEEPSGPYVDPTPAPEAIGLAQKMVRGRNLPPEIRAAAARDLAALPLPWLRRLDEEALAVVVLRDGQTLAESGILPEMTPERCRRDFAQAQELTRETVAAETAALAAEGHGDDFARAMAQRWLPDRIRESLMARLDAAGIGFSVEVAREPVDLRTLAGSKNIQDEDYESWKGLLAELNGGLVVVDGDRALASHEILLVPYVHHKGQNVSEVSRDSYAHFTAMEVRQHRGVHAWPNRLIMVHEGFVKEPAEEVGHYRVLVHEAGHAVDYAAEALVPDHRATVDRMYAADLEAYRRGENRFLTPRAMDDAREYLAEAIEAFTTRRVGDAADFYKPENNREELRLRNPELAAYVEKLLAT